MTQHKYCCKVLMGRNAMQKIPSCWPMHSAESIIYSTGIRFGDFLHLSLLAMAILLCCDLKKPKPHIKKLAFWGP